MGLKAIFHGWEDKWYALLDRLDQKVPVYKLIDPIDRVVPSFAVALGLVGLLILVFGILPLLGGNTDAVLSFRDEAGNPVSGITVNATWENGSAQGVTNSVGKWVLKGVPIGSAIALRVDDSDYAPFNQTIQITQGGQATTLTLEARELPPGPIAFQFVDGGGLSLDGKQLEVRLACSSGATLTQSLYVLTNGVLTITPPVGCGTLVGSVSGSGFSTVDGILFSADNPIIRLIGVSSEKGKVKVTVRANDTDAALTDMDVELFSQDGISIGPAITTNTFGVSIFNDVPVGSYYASVRDPRGDLAVGTSTPFTVPANQTISVDVGMGRQVQGSLRVSVTDKLTNAWIANATVKLVRKSDNHVVSSVLTTSSTTPVTFDVDERGPFILYAMHADYLSESKDIGQVSGDQTVSFALERLTPQNSGKIAITVADEDGLPVDNAPVILYDAASGFIAHGYLPKITDSNGIAKFQGINSGNYFARATKYPAGPSDSSTFATDKSIPATSSIRLTIGQATVSVNVKDVDGNPVPFATVEFRTDGTDECNPGRCVLQTDVQGNVSKSFKADRKIYVKASASGFSAFTSLSHQLYAAQGTAISVKLPRTILGDSPKIVLTGIRDPISGIAAGEIKSGRTYMAVFQLQIPAALDDLDGGGVHIRVGDEALIENDALQITGTAAPGTVVLKGTSYSPPTGYEADEANLTNGNAKWVNFAWNALAPGTYEIGVLVRVDEQATPLESLPIYYRAWGMENGTWLRDPVDAVLGGSANASGKHGQYAETYQQIYYNGKPIVCDETFCFSGEAVLNVDDELLVDGPAFPLIVNKAYRYSFVLSANSSVVYQNPKLRVFAASNAINPSSEILFSGYTVTGALGQPLQGSGLSTNDIPGGEGHGLDVGRLEQYKTIVGSFDFLAKEVAGTHLVVQLISDGDIVFQQVVEADITSNQALTIEVDPTTAAAFLPTTFDVHITTSEGFDIQDARVSLMKIDPNQIQQFIAHQYTDVAGKTSLIAPPSLPRTRFVIDAIKGGYASTPITIIVDENVVRFTPTNLVFSLPNSPNASAFLPLDMTNLTQNGLVLTHATVTGDFQGLLSNGEMENWVNQYEGLTTIASLETETIQIKASTSPSVNLLSGRTLKGNVILTFRAQGTQQEWVQVVPFTVELRVITACDGDAIQLSGIPSGSIETSAFDAKTQLPFQISNICQVEERPFPLRNLKAKVNWESNPIGNVELAVTDVGGTQNTTEVLRNGSYTILYDAFSTIEDTVYESVLTFTPFPGHIGETAEFTVTIAAEAGTPGQPQTLTEEFDMKIRVTNFETCVKFDPEPEEEIVIAGDEDEAEFEIDTSACGDIPVDIQFCNGANNSNCSGGAPEGRLYLSQFAINNLQGSKTITIDRRAGTLPGSYDLTVDARVPGSSLRRIASLNVKVEADSSYALDLEKSDLTLYQRYARDSTNVINRLLIETIQVKANVCDWEDVSGRPFNQQIGIAAFSGAATYAVASGVFSGFTLSAAACGPGCLAAVVAIAVFIALFDDPCDDYQTNPLPDYVINLSGAIDSDKVPADALDIRLSTNVDPHVDGEWVVTGSTITKKGSDTHQIVGAVFTNVTGYSDPNPLFGVATFRMKEHIHGDPSHSGSARTECDNGNFGAFYVGPLPGQGSCSPAQDTTREEKFHVKFRTQDLNQSLPNLNADSVACVAGTTLGATGSGTLPSVAFTWNWNDASGIAKYACDAANPDGIYCDATQFNIDLMKRIRALDGFLAANNYVFACPENPNAQPASDTFPNPNTVPGGFIGFNGVGYSFVNTEAVRFTGTIANNAAILQNGTLTVTMAPIVDEEPSSEGGLFDLVPETKTCTATVSVSPSGTATAECTILGLEDIQYRTSFGLTSDTTANIAYSSNVFVMNVASYSNESNATCGDLPKTTAILSGRPAINTWIDRDDPQTGQYVQDSSITFTPDVPNVQTLTDLLHFDALLIRDGYSHDFENDFRTYYSTNAFADAPSWFKGSPGVAGLNAFYGEDDQLVFSNKYFDDPTLPAAGKYRVDVSVFFGEDWRMLTSTGEPRATIGVDFYHLENPIPNSPFYKLPFDGQVGLVNTTYERVGYGLEYINEDQPIRVNDGLVQTQNGEGSTAMGQVNVSLSTDLRTLNTNPSTRGNLLEVSAPSGNAEQRIVFTPSLATPVMMNVNHAATTQPFSVFYQISQNGSPVDTGNTLTFWEGAGTCYDYSGVPIFERFNFTPDRAATPQDQLNAWQYSYALDWENARVGGNAYLRTILYTPANTGSYAIQGEGSNVKFFTSNYAQPSTSQLLDGISTLPYNNASQTIDSIQDVFDLVSERKICVANSGSQARFYWNPQTLYQQTSQTSLTAAGNALVAGVTCLGAPPQ